MKLRKAEARLERRIKGYEQTKKQLGATKIGQGFHKPGSTKKPAPGGRRVG